MRDNQNRMWKMGKNHLLVINLVLTFLVVVVYVMEESTWVKAITIGLYLSSMWLMIRIKNVKILVEEEETEDEYQ